MQKFFFAIDVGGTFIKSAIIDSKGQIYKSSHKTKPFNALGSEEYIMKKFSSEIKNALRVRKDIVAVGIAIPGTIDQKRGGIVIPHPENKTKFSALYKTSIRDELRKVFNIPVFLENDANAFTLGEAIFGVAKKHRKVIGITLGTGIGSGFVIDKKIATSKHGATVDGDIWHLKYKKSIIGDYFESKEIENRYILLSPGGVKIKKLTVKKISEKAFAGDKIARQTFVILGESLADALFPIVKKFKPESLVFGGQISNSSKLFLPKFKKDLAKKYPLKIAIKKSKLGASAALVGSLSEIILE